MTTPSLDDSTIPTGREMGKKPLKAEQMKQRKGTGTGGKVKTQTMDSLNALYKDVKGPRIALDSVKKPGTEDTWIDGKGNEFKILKTDKGVKVVYLKDVSRKYRSDYKKEYVGYLNMIKTLTGTKEEKLNVLRDYISQARKRITDEEAFSFISGMAYKKINEIEREGVAVKLVDRAEMKAKEEKEREADMKETTKAIDAIKGIISQASRAQMSRSLVLRRSKKTGVLSVIPVRHSTRKSSEARSGSRNKISQSEVAKELRTLKAQQKMQD